MRDIIDSFEDKLKKRLTRDKTKYRKNRSRKLLSFKEYYQKHKERLKTKAQSYRKENEAKIKAKDKERALKNKERRRIYAKEYYAKNRDTFKVKSKEYRSKPENKIREREHNRKRRMKYRLTDITPIWLKELWDTATHCVLCGIQLANHNNYPDGKHLDHIIPFNIKGTHTKDNVRYICCLCNLKRPKDGSDLWKRL